MLNSPLAPWPRFTDEEIEAVQKVLASGRVNYWTGQECAEFEREFAEWCGTEHAVTVTNGTLALELGLRALGIGAGDEVVVTPRTFFATISAVVLAGATPVFADVDRDSGNITRETIEPVLSDCTKAIIPVHLGGWPCDMPAMMDLAAKRGLGVIEDCAQAHGARISGESVGSFGDIGAWSFCQDKIVTTGGEGGMVTTNDKDLWARMWSQKDHGKSWSAVFAKDHLPGFRWVHESFGTNGRMLEMQAAIGRIQLRQMAEWTRMRTVNALSIRNALMEFPDLVRVPIPTEGMTHGFYRLYAYVRPDGLKPGWSRDRIVQEITDRGVPVFQGSCPEVYREPAFAAFGAQPHERLPVAQELGETSIAFLVHPTLTDADIAKSCDAAKAVLSDASV